MKTIDTETTPLESPYSLKAVMGELQGIRSALVVITDNQFQMIALYHELKAENRVFAREIAALKLTRGWMPYVMSILSLAVSLYLALAIQPLLHR